MAIEVNLLNNNNTVGNININMQRIKEALQDGISRSGDTPNQMEADLDMNSNNILNADTVDTKYLVVDGERVAPKDLAIADIPDGSVTREKIAPGAVGTDELEDGAVTSPKLAANAVGPRELVRSDFENVIANGAFETGDFSGWDTPPSGFAVYPKDSGSSAMATCPAHYALGTGDGYSSDQTLAQSLDIPCKPGDDFMIEFDYAVGGPAPRSADFAVVAYFSAPEGSYIASNEVSISGASNITDWLTATEHFTVPVGAAHLYSFGVVFKSTSNPDSSLYITNIRLRRVPSKEMDTRTTQLFGSGSKARTTPARFGDVVDLDDWLVGDGNTNNDAGIGALVSYMAANPGKTYRSRKARQYAFQSNFTLPSNIKLRMEGATFVRTSANSTNNAAISLGTKTDADEVSLRVQGSVQCFVGVEVGDQFKGSVRVVADEQKDNRGGDVRQGIRVYGGNHEIDTLTVRYFNQAISIGEGPGNKRSDIRVRNVDVAFYTRGLHCRSATDLLLDYLNIRGRSPDALPDPGINGVLMDGCEDVVVRGGFIKDAGEHGFRLGGPTPNKRVTVSDLTLSQNGQSGFKVWAGGGNPSHEDITLSNVKCIDSGYDGDGLGFNDFGFMMQNIHRLKMVNCHASKQNGTYCAYDGFYLSGLTASQIAGCSSTEAQRDGMRISQWNDNGYNPQSFNTNGIYDFMVKGSGGSGVSIQFSNGYDVRDLIMSNLLVLESVHGVNCMASAGEFPQPSFISAMGRDLSGNLFHNTSGISNLKTLNLMS